MQIHYIWIKEFNAIKESGINLSSKFLIHIEKKHDFFSMIIMQNPDYISNFFKEENVTDVCAIIGKNGTGKSSVLKYIKENMPNGLSSRIENDIIVYSVDEKHYISCPKSINLKLENNTDVDFKTQKYTKIRSSSGLGNADYIYYNYLLDYNEDNTNWHGLQNISTTSLLQKERKRILEEIQSVEFKKVLLNSTSDIQYLHMMEVYQAVIFINNTEEELPFLKPKSLHLMLDSKEENYFFGDHEKYSDVIDLINSLKSIVPHYSSPEENFIGNLWYSVFINFLITERKYSVNNPYQHIVNLEEGDTRDLFIERFFTTMKGVTFPHSLNGKIYDVGIPKLENLSILIPSFIALASELIENKTINIKNETEAFFQLNTGSELDFKEFQDLYVKIKGITSFIQFRWHSLSSGEQSYLSLMSRFYSLVHEESVRLQKNLIILIDEGDTGYHPEWQRIFFKNTICFLSSLFHKHSIQLIFTSNTPFLTSDLPKTNILFVQKTEEGIPFFLDKQNHNSNTFAANIHTLFSDSFYMDGMLIGEYAKDKINEIIKYLNDPEVTMSNQNYKKIIDSIGEPLLRKKLQDMWFEKFGLQEKLEVLRKQVAEVEQKIKDTNDKNSL
ncbi:AAA family ATPase [Flavobacterium sp. I3-2]|uniref:AAA family ATPase n=1 Tax=Flavobacterium sp. I3-2 TaxID=2748319 RepID=UPI0015A99B32|nr:AAA family ATPase [Flavobacterium sp. I3-2]MDV4102914.1 hypothetical protein [Elizabethkingia anophelis]